MTNTNTLIKDHFVIGVYSRLSKEMLDFVIEKMETFFAVNF